MNYLAEIKLFYDWLETHELSPTAIALWHALMHTANRSGWKPTIRISSSALELRTGIARSTVYRVRKQLEAAGLLELTHGRGRSRCSYSLRSLTQHFVCQIETQNEDNTPTKHSNQQFVFQIGTQDDTQTPCSELENEFNQHFVCQNETQNADSLLIHKLNYTESNNIEKQTKEIGSSKAKTTKPKTTPQPPSIKTDQILSTIESPWRELMFSWLEYKRVQKSAYRSEIGIRKCLMMLQELSNNNPNTAQQIIDQSIANNWAGLFPLRNGAMSRGHPPATGQRIGQIKQPDSEEKRQELLNKLRPK